MTTTLQVHGHEAFSLAKRIVRRALPILELLHHRSSKHQESLRVAQKDRGEAHALFDQAMRGVEKKGGSSKGVKAQKSVPAKPGRGLSRAKFAALVTHLQKQRRLFFSSPEQRETFIDQEFKTHARGGKELDFNGFFEFYVQHGVVNAAEALEHARATRSEMEFAFVSSDATARMELNVAELTALLHDQFPPGVLPPPEAELAELARTIIREHATDKDKFLSFAEFSSAWGIIVAPKLKALRLASDEEMNCTPAFAVTAPGVSHQEDEDDLDDDDLDKLERAIRRRYEGHVWVCHEADLALETRQQSTLEREPQGAYGHAIGRATRAGKHALFLRHPDQIMDNITQYYSRQSAVRVLDLQDLIVEQKAHGAEAAATVRNFVAECWRDGCVCALRLGATAPEFMSPAGWNLKGILPLDFLDPANKTAGELPMDLQCMAQSYANDTQRPPMTRIKEGFEIIFISNYHMHNYATYLRGRVPLQWIQPVQVCRSRAQVAAVLRDPKTAVPDDGLEEATAKMDALADLL